MPMGAYIVECVRTATGKRKGALAGVHPADLGAVVVDALVDRSGVDPAAVDDVVWGCVSQIGAQAGNIGRSVVLSSKLPESVPGTTCDRQCGSSQQAIHQAAQAVMSGTQDIVIAGGVENMSTCPIGSNVMVGMAAGHGFPFNSKGIESHYPGKQFSQFAGAEMLAKKYDLSRAELDAMAARSHKRGAEAYARGAFDNEIVPVEVEDEDGRTHLHAKDEGLRPGTTVEKLAKLKTMAPGGVLTPGTASQISDGAAAVMIVNERGLEHLRKQGKGAKARARIVGLALAGSDPVVMLEGPIPATKNVLAKTGLSLSDMDLYEVNEAFASVPGSWAKALGADHNKLNVCGSAMALGHPLGATGAKLMTTLVNQLEQRNGRYGLLAICEGGGTANATIIERCAPDGSSLPRARL